LKRAFFPKAKMVRIAGLEPANGVFSGFPVRGVSLPFIAQRVTRNPLYLQALFGI
jgi:hypothetical protein